MRIVGLSAMLVGVLCFIQSIAISDTIGTVFSLIMIGTGASVIVWRE